MLLGRGRRRVVIAAGVVAAVWLGACATTIDRTPADMARVKVATESITFTESDIDYEVDADVPVVSGTDAAVAKRINSYLRTEAQQSIDTFRKQIESIERDSKPVGKRTSRLAARFETTLLRAQLMSVRMDISALQAGASAPEEFVATYVFDLGTGRHIGLEDLYGAKDYLALFSGRAHGDLPDKYNIDPDADKGRFNDGVEAKDKSFQAYVLTDEGVRVYFQPGQIAPMAEGILELDVPYDVLDPFVNPHLPPIVELHKQVSAAN